MEHEVLSSSQEIQETQKLNLININNIEILERLKKSMELLDKIELYLDQKVKNQLYDIENTEKTIVENMNIFKIISERIINQI